MGRETRGSIVRKKGKRGSIRLIMMVVVGLVVGLSSCRVMLDFERKLLLWCAAQREQEAERPERRRILTVSHRWPEPARHVR
jgi:hypothetical protein